MSGHEPGTFPAGRLGWLGNSAQVRNVVRQELIARQLAYHLPAGHLRVLDVGAGQGLQSLRLARRGHEVHAIEPDDVMRRRFADALADEPPEVRARLDLRAGAVGSLADCASPPYDLVLLLGVLMYLDDSRPVLAEIAPLVADGGVVAVATRLRTSVLWRPAARQDWAAAAAAFDEDRRAAAEGRDVRYVNEIGAPARADDLDRLVGAASAAGLNLWRWYGVRTAVDLQEEDPAPPSDPRTLATLLAVEERLGAVDPFRQLAQLAHLILRREPPEQG